MSENTNAPGEGGRSRRDEILGAAARVIAERGIKQATVRDIGEAAGILSGSLYYHFDSKDQIVLELLLPHIVQQYESASAICESTKGIDAVRLLIRDSVLATAMRPDRAIILRNEARSFDEIALLAPVQSYRAKVLDLWLKAMEQGIEMGSICGSLEPDIVLRAIFDGALGASRWFSGSRHADPEDVADALVDFYVRGLAAG